MTLLGKYQNNYTLVSKDNKMQNTQLQGKNPQTVELYQRFKMSQSSDSHMVESVEYCTDNGKPLTIIEVGYFHIDVEDDYTMIQQVTEQIQNHPKHKELIEAGLVMEPIEDLDEIYVYKNQEGQSKGSVQVEYLYWHKKEAPVSTFKVDYTFSEN